MNCISCGNTLPEDSRFCPNCGSTVSRQNEELSLKTRLLGKYPAVTIIGLILFAIFLYWKFSPGTPLTEEPTPKQEAANYDAPTQSEKAMATISEQNALRNGLNISFKASPGHVLYISTEEITPGDPKVIAFNLLEELQKSSSAQKGYKAAGFTEVRIKYGSEFAGKVYKVLLP